MSEGRPGPALPLRTWLLLSHTVVLLLPVVAIVASGALAKDLLNQTRVDLQHQAALIGLMVAHELDEGAGLPEVGAALGPLLVEARERTLAGVRVVDHTGVVVASSGDELGEDLSHRPEVAKALEGVTAHETRPRPPATHAPLDSVSRRALVRLYLAEPVQVHGQTVGAVVLSRTPKEEVQALYQMVPWWTAAAPLLITFLLALYAGQMFSRSLRSLEASSLQIAEGRLEALDALAWPRGSRVGEVRSLAGAVATMATRLRERLDYISEFAGNVSHEFKTPLATLRGSAELLRDDHDMAPAQRQRFLDNSIAELDRLEELVTGLLTLARAESTGTPSVLALDALLAEAAQRRGVSVQGQAGRVRGDAAQLSAVLDNLLDNASEHGGTAHIEAWQRGQRTGFDVVDDGPGISEANLPRVFERFFTTRRDRGGTGLGLALVRAICRAHGGEVTARSRPGRTVLSVDLPAALASRP